MRFATFSIFKAATDKVHGEGKSGHRPIPGDLRSAPRLLRRQSGGEAAVYQRPLFMPYLD